MLNDNVKLWAGAFLFGSLVTFMLFNSIPLFRISQSPELFNVITIDYFDWQPPEPTPISTRPKLKPDTKPVKKPASVDSRKKPPEIPKSVEPVLPKVEQETVSPIDASDLAKQDKKSEVNEEADVIQQQIVESDKELQKDDAKDSLPVPVPIFELTSMPRFAHKVDPVFPVSMQQLGKQAIVKLEVLIDKHGYVRDVSVLDSGGDQFDKAAIDALRLSTFIPAQVNGKPVAVRLRLPVAFNLK